MLIHSKSILFIVLILFSTMSGNCQTNTPLKSVGNAMIFEKKPSIISIPVNISLQDIQKQINAGLPDLIYEDNSFKDDGLKVKVWRKGNLIFTENKDGVLTYEVPLKVWAQKEITILGISQAPSTDFELKVKFSSKFGITEDYDILTQTKGLSYSWITKPVLRSGFVDIPIGPIIGSVITQNFPLFSEQIDATIKENFSLKPYVIDAWNTAKKPVLVSEEYNTWLKTDPIEVFITPLVSIGSNLKATLGIKLFIETLVGNPLNTFTSVSQVPKLKMLNTIPEIFEVQLLNVISYSEANVIAKRTFVGETFEFSNGKYKIVVTDLEIGHENENLIFDIKSKGSFVGTIKVKGIPVYDEERGMVILSKVQLDIKTRNFLHKAAAWLLEGSLERKFEKEFGMPVSELIEETKKSVHEAMNSEFSKGVRMQGQILSVTPDQVLVTEEGILAILEAKAKVQLIVSGM